MINPLWCPLVSGKHDGLKHLDILDHTLLARCVALFEDQGPHLCLRAQADQRGSVGILVIRDHRAQVPLVRHDDHDRLRRVLYGVHAEV